MSSLNSRNQLSRSLAVLFVTVCAAVPIWAQATVTFSGRVTDQNTGLGLAGVAVVAQGNQTGTRVAISDAQGNYNLPVGANTNIRVRAYRTNFVFNPIFAGYASPGGFPITGALQLNFSGAGPFPILIFAQAPVLLTADESLDALALDGVLNTRDPLAPVNNNYPGADKRTRVKLFLMDLDLFSGETLSLISVQARDGQQIIYDLAVEDLRKVPGSPWLAQLTVILPGNVTGPNELMVSVSARGQVSNAARLRIQ